MLTFQPAKRLEGYLNGASSFFFEERLLSAFGRAEYAIQEALPLFGRASPRWLL